MIAIPSNVADIAAVAWNQLGPTLGMGMYGAVHYMLEIMRRPPPPLTASRATLINRLRYPGGRKFRRALKRLDLRQLPRDVSRALRSGPACRRCGAGTADEENVRGRFICPALFTWTTEALTADGWRRGDFLYCEPLAHEDPPQDLGTPRLEK